MKDASRGQGWSLGTGKRGWKWVEGRQELQHANLPWHDSAMAILPPRLLQVALD